MRQPKGGNTARFTFGPVLAIFPLLRPNAGYLVRFPFQVEDLAEGRLLTIELRAPQHEPTGRTSSKRLPPADAGATP